MRTTIRLKDTLLKRAKLYALEHDMTFTTLVTEALEEKITQKPDSKPFELVTFEGKLQPGVNLDSNAELLEFMEEGLDVVSRR